MRPVRLHPHRPVHPALCALATALCLVLATACSPSEEAEDGTYDERVAAEHEGDRPGGGPRRRGAPAPPPAPPARRPRTSR